MFEAALSLLGGGGSEGSSALTTVVVNDGGCGGCGGYYPAYGYYDPYGYYPAYGYYDPYYYPAYTGYYYTYPTYYTYAEAPALTGAEGAAVQTQGDASVLGTAHTTHLVADDFVWTRGYAWYPDTPGQYPESKWDWYYSDGGLYDQRHELALLPGAAGPTEEGKPAGEKQEKPANAMPGHLLMCGHALVLGAVDATSKAVQTGNLESWFGDFKITAKEAAGAATPVGGYIMSEHVLKEAQAPEA